MPVGSVTINGINFRDSDGKSQDSVGSETDDVKNRKIWGYRQFNISSDV